MNKLKSGRWTHTFLSTFDATHPTSPAEKAASVLRVRSGDPPSLSALAGEAGASRSRLVRDFRQRHGMSVGEYLTRVRLRAFIDDLRKPSASALRAAEDVGYASYHNVVDALRRRTGLSPTEIRGLSRDALRDVLDLRLALGRVHGAGNARSRLTSRRWSPIRPVP